MCMNKCVLLKKLHEINICITTMKIKIDCIQIGK